MTAIQRQLIQLISCVVCGSALPEGFSPSDPEELYALSKSHELVQLAAQGIMENGLLDPKSAIAKDFRRQKYRAVWAVTLAENVLSQIRGVFEENGIDFIPLKGAVLRKLYPEPWMRVSGDLDILVRSDDIPRAKEILADKLRYSAGRLGRHHDQVNTPDGLHIDLHFTLTETRGKAKEILDTVWEHAVPVEGSSRERVMEDEYLYFYHMFHAANHFQNGGCGIRVLLDTWVLNHRLRFNQEERKKLLRQGGLLRFAENLESLSEQWFSFGENGAYTELETYIWDSGTFGQSRRLEARVAGMGGRFQFLLSRLFPPCYKIWDKYPVLRRWRILLPFCWIHRWVTTFFTGKLQEAAAEAEEAWKLSASAKTIEELYRNLGLY